MPDFTTLAATKTALGLGSATGDESNINALIPQVTALALGPDLMDRPGFFQNGSDVTEYPSVVSAGTRLFLDRYPNAVVTSIHVSTDAPRVYDATTILTADQDYIVNPETGVVHRIASTWPTDVRAVQVIYDGGYTVGGAAPFPAELERAAQMIIAAMLQKGKDRIYHLTGTNLGDGQVTGIRFDDIPDTARAIFLGYRDRRVV